MPAQTPSSWPNVHHHHLHSESVIESESNVGSESPPRVSFCGAQWNPSTKSRRSIRDVINSEDATHPVSFPRGNKKIKSHDCVGGSFQGFKLHHDLF